MDEEKVKELIDDLPHMGRFIKIEWFSTKARLWFARKITSYLRKQQGDLDLGTLQSRALAAIEQATRLVEARLQIGEDLVGGYDPVTAKTRRAQIIYGAIAIHPGVFLSGANQSLLDFIFKRRLRAVSKMETVVNLDTKLPIFEYPKPDKKTCSKAREFWAPYHYLPKNPFRLSKKVQDRPETAIEAIENLFKRDKSDDPNCFACAHVATIIHMDSLLAGVDPRASAKELAEEGPEYLTIDHPHAAYRIIEEEPMGGVVFLLDDAPSGDYIRVAVSQPWAFGTAGMLQQGTLNVYRLCQIVEGDKREDIEVIGVECNGCLEARTYTDNAIIIKRLKQTYHKFARIVPQTRNLDFPPFHFLSDTRPGKALFEQVDIPWDDLQVGDHVWVPGHPLQSAARSLMEGEHVLITERWRHDNALDHVMVSGHGVRDWSERADRFGRPSVTTRKMRELLKNGMQDLLDEARITLDVYLTRLNWDDPLLEWEPLRQRDNWKEWLKTILKLTLANKRLYDVVFEGDMALVEHSWTCPTPEGETTVCPRPIIVLRGSLNGNEPLDHLFDLELENDLGLEFLSALEQPYANDTLREAFRDLAGIVLSPGPIDVPIEPFIEGENWRICDIPQDQTYAVLRNRDLEKLDVYLFERCEQRIEPRDWILMMQPGRYSENPQPEDYTWAIRRKPLPDSSELAENKQYGISFFNDFTGREEYLSLYYTAKGTGRFEKLRCVTDEDWPEKQLYGVQARMVFCTRPRVDANAEYLDYLRELGAIAP